MNWISLLGLQAYKERCARYAAEGKQAASDRLTLAALEWAEEKKHWQTVLVLVVAALALGVVAMLLVSLAVLVYFWDSPQRVVMAWVIAGVWLFAWLLVAYALRVALRQKRPAFHLTRTELARDWQEWQDWQASRQARATPADTPSNTPVRKKPVEPVRKESGHD